MDLHRCGRGARVAAALLLVALAGCTAPPDAATPGPDSATGSAREPTFDGPYAAELAEFHRSAANDFVRDVLADGTITDAEYAEMTERFRSCLADRGITFNGFQPDGSYSTSLAPGCADTHGVVSECSHTSGQDSVGALHDIMTANPDNTDAAVAIADCLVRARAVPASYTAQDYRADRQGRFRDTEQLEPGLAAVLDTCMSDPFEGATESTP